MPGRDLAPEEKSIAESLNNCSRENNRDADAYSVQTDSKGIFTVVLASTELSNAGVAVLHHKC